MPPRWPILLMLCVSAACRPQPQWYGMPEQRQSSPVSQPTTLGPFATMADPNADAYIVSGVNEPDPKSPWRWTQPRVEMRFYLTQVRGLRFTMELVLPDATFAETGPVTVSVTVNGSPLGKQRFASAGSHTLALPAPERLLKLDALNTVVIEPDKIYVARDDGARLGFILAGAGFRD
ncbi:MAG: hypothetical protein ACE15B_19755 [Bryobacteraceae bacterium]